MLLAICLSSQLCLRYIRRSLEGRCVPTRWRAVIHELPVASSKAGDGHPRALSLDERQVRPAVRLVLSHASGAD